VILILCLVLGLGGSNGHVKIQILASVISFLILGCEISFSIKIPFIILESSTLPPVLPYILIKSKLTSLLSISATESTASTAILANYFLLECTIFEPNAV